MGFYPNFGSESPEEEFYASAYLNFTCIPSRGCPTRGTCLNWCHVNPSHIDFRISWTLHHSLNDNYGWFTKLGNQGKSAKRALRTKTVNIACASLPLLACSSSWSQLAKSALHSTQSALGRYSLWLVVILLRKRNLVITEADYYKD